MKQFSSKKRTFGPVLRAAVLVLLAGILTLAGCSSPLSAPVQENAGNGVPESAPDGLGRVTITVGNASSGAERTLAPAALAFTRYEVSFSSTTGNKPSESFTGTTKSVDLSPGDWTITLTAYTGTGATEKASARGSAKKTIKAGDTESAPITLEPYGESGVTGTFSYGITITEAINSGTLTVTSAADTATVLKTVDLTKEADRTGTAELAAGYYLMNIAIVKDKTPVGRTETLHIYPGLTTSVTYKFEGTELVNITPTATVADVSIPGTAGVALAALDTADVKITLANESFKDAILKGEEVTTWFPGLPEGKLVAKAKTDTAAGSSSITIAITGTPTAESSAVLAISIPAADLSTGAALTVTTNPTAKFAIALVPPTADPKGWTTETSVPAAAYFSKDLDVELKTTTEGADIWYTLDDTDPTVGGGTSTKYTGTKISVPLNDKQTTTTLKAIAVKAGFESSAVFSAQYVLRPREATPTVTIDYANETLTGFLNTQTTYYWYTDFTEDAKYLSGTRTGLTLTGLLNNMSTDISSLLKPTPQRIAIVKGENTSPLGNGTRDSLPQFIDLPARPAAPDTLDTEKVTESDASDGKITGTTTAMEYKLSSATDWIACPGTEVTRLAKGDYLVRFKTVTTGDTKAFASAQIMVAIEPPAPSLYGIWMGDKKVSDAETLTDALVYFNTASNYQPAPTNYTLKLAAGTETIGTQTRLEGGTTFDATSGTIFYTDSTLTIEGPDDGIAVIQNPNASSWITIEKISLVLKSNITFTYTGIASNNQPLFFVSNGTLEMNTGVLITGNSHTGNQQGGGGVRVGTGGIFNMKGGEISGNSSGRGGGGVAVYNNATFNMSGGTISGNTTYTQNATATNVVSGGGVGVNSQAKFVKTGGIIMGDTDDADGAANTVSKIGNAEALGAAVFVNNSAVSGTTAGGYPRREGKVTDDISYDGLGKEANDSTAPLTGTWD